MTNAKSGLVVCCCPQTGLDFSLGFECDELSLRTLPTQELTVQCPHCGSQHIWNRSTSRLENAGALMPVAKK